MVTADPFERRGAGNSILEAAQNMAAKFKGKINGKHGSNSASATSGLKSRPQSIDTIKSFGNVDGFEGRRVSGA